MLIFKYSCYLLQLVVVSLCFSCTSGTSNGTEVSAVDSLTQRLDSIGFEPYVQSLIKSGNLVNFELIGKAEGEGTQLLKDSLYYAMSSSDWFVYGIAWAYGRDNYTFYTRKEAGKDIENFFKNHIPDYSVHLYTVPAPLEGIVMHILDSIKVIKPILNFSDDVLVCGQTDMLLFDGHKFFYLSGNYGQPSKQFMERLAPVFDKYFKAYYKKRKKKK